MRSRIARGRAPWPYAAFVAMLMVSAIASAQVMPGPASTPGLTCRTDAYLWRCVAANSGERVHCNAFGQCTVNLRHGAYGFPVTPTFAALVRTAIREPRASWETPASLLDVLRAMLHAAIRETDAEFGAPATALLPIVMPRLRRISDEGAEAIQEALERLALHAPGEYARFAREVQTVSYRPWRCGGPRVARACTGGDLGREVVLETLPEDDDAFEFAATLAHEARHHRTEGGTHHTVMAHDLERDERLRERLLVAATLERLDER